MDKLNTRFMFLQWDEGSMMAHPAKPQPVPPGGDEEKRCEHKGEGSCSEGGSLVYQAGKASAGSIWEG